jgi:hypothetical protein
VIRVIRAQRVLKVLLVHKDLLVLPVPKVFKETKELRDPLVLKVVLVQRALKVLPAQRVLKVLKG